MRRRRNEPHARSGVPRLRDPRITLCGQLSAFAGLAPCAILIAAFGLDQVVTGHAGNGLTPPADGRVLESPFSMGDIAIRVLHRPHPCCSCRPRGFMAMASVSWPLSKST